MLRSTADSVSPHSLLQWQTRHSRTTFLQCLPHPGVCESQRKTHRTGPDRRSTDPRWGLAQSAGGGRHSSSSRTFLNILPNGGTILNDFLLRSSHALVALYIKLLSTTSHSVQVSVQLHRGSMSSTLTRLVLVIDRPFGSGSEDGFMFVHACRRRQKANYITR